MIFLKDNLIHENKCILDAKDFISDGFGPGYYFGSEDKNYQYNAAIIDVETNSSDPNEAEITEISIVKFSFSNNLEMGKIVKTLQQFNQPKKQIPPDIVEITGITNEMVRGKALDFDEINDFLKDVKIIIAHNAQFDRLVCERNILGFNDEIIWGCSFKDINWNDKKISSGKLDYICVCCGFVYTAHRAINDCYALLCVLNTTYNNKELLYEVIKTAMTPKKLIRAYRSPFETKDILKKHKYTWNANNKVWEKIVVVENVDEEIEFLKAVVYNNNTDTSKVYDISIKKNHTNIE